MRVGPNSHRSTSILPRVWLTFRHEDAGECFVRASIGLAPHSLRLSRARGRGDRFAYVAVVHEPWDLLRRRVLRRDELRYRDGPLHGRYTRHLHPFRGDSNDGPDTARR